MVQSKTVYIYIEGFDLKDELLKQEQRHIRKDEAGEFIFVKYTQNREFKYTQNGVEQSGLPSIDADTKIVVMGHGVPKSNKLSQLSSGGGTQLTVQAIADAVAGVIPPGQRVQFSLRGCKTGVGKHRNAHEDSFAGKLFKALSKKGLKPEISASLSFTWMSNTGQLGRFVAVKDVPVNSIRRDYEKFARRVYENNPETLEDFEKFRIIQERRRIVADTKARGSKVVLTDEAGSMKIDYPYGDSGESFDVNKLGNTGKIGLAHLLGKEALLIQKFKARMGEAKEELRKIFDAFEAENPDIKQTVQYIQLKQFLLEEDYYFDVRIIEKWIAAECYEIDDRYALLVDEIRANKIITNFEMSHHDIEEIYNYDGQNPPDLDLAYLEFGMDVVLGKGNYLSPISPEQLVFLNESTRQALLIALGKQMMMPGYTLDKNFVYGCLAEAEQNKEKQYQENGEKYLKENGLEKMSRLLEESIRQKFVIELGKNEKGHLYDEEFVLQCQALMHVRLQEVGRELIENDRCEFISQRRFNFLDPERQETLATLIGGRDSGCPFSEDDKMLMDICLDIARENELAAHQKEAGSSADSTSRFFRSVSRISNLVNEEHEERADLGMG